MHCLRWTPIVGQSGALFKAKRHWAVARETPTKGLARPRGGLRVVFRLMFLCSESVSTEI